MPINIATLGMFKDCCGSRVAGGGGAPPYRQNWDEPVKPTVQVKKLEVKNISESLIDKIKVTLLE
jgi:hypothetical protein